MSIESRTTKEISDNLVAQISSTINQTIPLLPKSFIIVLSKVLAAVWVILYKYGGFIFLQLFIDTASAKETEISGKKITPLIEWGKLIGVGVPTEGTRAELSIDITVENQVGSLGVNEQLINSDNGVTYLTLSAVLLNAPVVTVSVRAAEDQAGGGGVGVIGNLEIGDKMSFANPIANVAKETTVSAVLVTAADAEDLDVVYRQRVKDRFTKRPEGGALTDYEIWGEEVPGIINIYPYTGLPGQVNVYSEATVLSSGDPDGIPTQAQLDAVKASIDLDQGGRATRRPANSFVNSLAITRQTIFLAVSGLVVEDTATVQALIVSGLEQEMLSAEPFIEGVTVLPKKDRINIGQAQGVVNDIVTAEGGTFNTVVMTVLGVPVNNYSLNEGEKAKASVSFV